MTFDKFNLELYVYFVNAIKRSIILIGDPDLTNDKMKIWTKYIWDLMYVLGEYIDYSIYINFQVEINLNYPNNKEKIKNIVKYMIGIISVVKKQVNKNDLKNLHLEKIFY